MNNLANVLQAQGRLAEAENFYRDALALEPEFLEALYNLGGTLQALGREEEARECLERVLALLLAEGSAAAQEGHYAEAAGCYERALTLKPDDPGLLDRLGVVCDAAGRHAEALAALRRSLELRPGDAGTLFNLGMALQGEGAHAQAIEAFDQVLRVQPDNGEAALAKAISRLSSGDFAAGWREYEVRYQGRFEYPRVSAPDLAFPMWRGEPLAGKRLLLVGEQGFGDQMQFIRFAKVLADMGATVDAAVDARLQRLVASVPGVRRLVPGVPRDSRDYDYWTLLLSVPLHLGTRLETIPAPASYASPPAGDVAKWASRLATLPPGRPRVGLVWTGRDRKINRTMPFEALAPLAAIDDIDFIGMQFGEPAAGSGFPRLQLGPEIGDFADQAALVANLDLLVTVDTAIAHVAGALGHPVWVMLPFNPDWRWMRGRDDTPWYPRTRLYRQTSFGDWAGVVARVAADLGAWKFPPR